MSAPLPLVTLLTDFGDRDHFVASMKGVILTINPQVRIIDLSHHVQAHDIEEAAFILKSCYRYFPDGTIHVAVVDPGVGSRRRPLLVRTSRWFFIAPDNGLLSHVFSEESEVEVRHIENAQYRHHSPGATFDGRDVFAPSAAWLTRGQSVGSYGRVLHDYVRLSIAQPKWDKQALVGQVVHVDCFGNLLSNLTPEHLREVQERTGRIDVCVRIAGYTIEGLVSSYSEGSRSEPRALVNSNGQIEVFVTEGRAVDLIKSGRGACVALC